MDRRGTGVAMREGGLWTDEGRSLAAVQALALRVMADRLKQSEALPEAP